jgi:hypothetical protein
MPKLLGLSAAEVRAGVGIRAALQQSVEHSSPGRLGEGCELAHRILGFLLRALRIHADEHDVLEPKLPILDLGDIFEFGRQAADATQRRALLTVVLLTVGRCFVSGIRHLALDRGGIDSAESRHPRLGVGAAQHPFDGVVSRARFGFVHHLNSTSLRLR